MVSSVRSSSMVCLLNRMSGKTLTLAARPYSSISRAVSSKIANAQNYTPSLLNRSIMRLQMSPYFSSSSSNHLPIALLLLLTSIGMGMIPSMAEAETDDAPNEQSERINRILDKPPQFRPIEERIELFHYLVMKGAEETKKAKDKDVVVVFGETDAGKSTLVNFLYGCQMTKINDLILVDEKSPIKAVAKIGITFTSETSLPKKIPDISFIPDVNIKSTEESTTGAKEHFLTFYDMPGLTDNRGIEVVLANAIAMKQIVQDAHSVRFVMVFEHGRFTPAKFKAWIEAVLLLAVRFNHTVGTGNNSLCIVMTKKKDPVVTLASIKEEIDSLAIATKSPLNLSNYVTLYDPLETSDRRRLLDTIFNNAAYSKIDTNISIGGIELLEAIDLGDKMKVEVIKEIERSRNTELVKSVSIVNLTRKIADLGNERLMKPHEEVSNAILEHAKKLTSQIDPRRNPPHADQIVAFKKYKSLKNNFASSVNFERADSELRYLIRDTKDPRWVAWNQPETSLTSLGAALVFGAIATAGGPLAILFWVAAGTSTLAGCKAISHWLSPTPEEKDETLFFKGP